MITEYVYQGKVIMKVAGVIPVQRKDTVQIYVETDDPATATRHRYEVNDYYDVIEQDYDRRAYLRHLLGQLTRRVILRDLTRSGS